MSIATLKKKTQTKYNNMSVGERQFSINGTHRSQGYVGQTSLSRSLPRTLMKGNVAIGHGGCCGKFKKTPIVQSAVISVENPNVVKSSVLGTSGMISTKYAWIKRPQPYTTVKPDNNQNNNSQSDYITYLVDKTLNNTEYAVSDSLLTYPPANLTIPSITNSPKKITLSNLPYGNGDYTISSDYYGFSGNGPFFISNPPSTSDYWQTTGYSVTSTYNGNTIYSLPANVSITRVSNTSYNGRWVQIEFPYKIKLENLYLVPKPGSTVNIAQNIILAGLDNNNEWIKLNEMKLSSIPNSNEIYNFNITKKVAFKQYRLIVVSSFSDSPSLFNIQMKSYDKYFCEKEANYTTVTSCTKNTCTTNKPGVNYNYAIPCGEYMKRLINCRTKDKYFYVTTTNKKQPFAGFN